MNDVWHNKEWYLSLATWASVTMGLRSRQIPGVAFSDIIPHIRALSMRWKSGKVLQEDHGHDNLQLEENPVFKVTP